MVIRIYYFLSVGSLAPAAAQYLEETLPFKAFKALHDGLLLCVPLLWLCYDSVGQITAHAGEPWLQSHLCPVILCCVSTRA